MPDIMAGRLAPVDYVRNFDDAKTPLNEKQALIESSRCFFCYDAPCIEACPTGIDIPAFIRGIQTGNVMGAAKKILDENIMGGMCARVCPTEILCEQACVRNLSEEKPVKIGLLQRYATDEFFETSAPLYQRAAATGKKIAVVGGGPAGLSCAHRLAQLGHSVTIFEAREKLGGLNEYGIAAYKTPHDFAQKEVEFILSLGGISVNCGAKLGRDIKLGQLRRDFDAVFLGLGLSATNDLQLEGEDLRGVEDAVSYIAQLRQAVDKAAVPVGRKVVVIGGGNTAIDVAVQAKRLGAEEVTIVYRRGPGQMSATWKEQEFAQTNGVLIRHWARPVRIMGENGTLRAVQFEHTALDSAGRLAGKNEHFTLEADMLFKAIGQIFVPDPVQDSQSALDLLDGRIVVNEDCQTSLGNVFAGGDCTKGTDLTVRSVQDGKIAAHAIDRFVSAPARLG